MYSEGTILVMADWVYYKKCEVKRVYRIPPKVKFPFIYPAEHSGRHRLQRKSLVGDSGMHHGTCVTHVPWCMSGSLTRGGWENVPGIPGACATRNFAYLIRVPCRDCCSPGYLHHPDIRRHGIGLIRSTGLYLPQESIQSIRAFSMLCNYAKCKWLFFAWDKFITTRFDTQ